MWIDLEMWNFHPIHFLSRFHSHQAVQLVLSSNQMWQNSSTASGEKRYWNLYLHSISQGCDDEGCGRWNCLEVVEWVLCRHVIQQWKLEHTANRAGCHEHVVLPHPLHCSWSKALRRSWSETSRALRPKISPRDRALFWDLLWLHNMHPSRLRSVWPHGF